MMPNNPEIAGVSPAQAEIETREFFRRVFSWMFLGLAITGIAAYIVAGSPALIGFFLEQSFVFYTLLLLELAAVFVLARSVDKMSPWSAGAMFILYSLLTGVTFSVLFLLYDIASIGKVFLITAGTFGAMAVYGYTTQRDLTSMGSMAFMALIGLILASIVNLFIMNERVDLILAYIGVAIFVALTAYDIQKLKHHNIIGNANTDTDKKEAIMGALTLYLDFINLFLKLLRLLGKRRR